MSISNSTKTYKKYQDAHKEIEKFKKEYKDDIKNYVKYNELKTADQKKTVTVKFLKNEKAHLKSIEEKHKFFAPIGMAFGIISPILSVTITSLDSISTAWKWVSISSFILIPILLSLYAWYTIEIVREAVVRGLVVDLLLDEQEN